MQTLRSLGQKLLCCSPAGPAQHQGYAALPAGGLDCKLQHAQGHHASAAATFKAQHTQREGLPAISSSHSTPQREQATGNIKPHHLRHSPIKEGSNTVAEVDYQAAYQGAPSRSETAEVWREAGDLPLSNDPTLDTTTLDAAAYPISIPSSLQSRQIPRHNRPTSSRGRSQTPLQDSLLAHGSSHTADDSQPPTPASGMLLSTSRPTGIRQEPVPHSAFSNAHHLSPFEAAQKDQPAFQRRIVDTPQGLRNTQSMDRRRSLHRSHSMRIADLSKWRSGNLASASANLDSARSHAFEDLGSSIPIQQNSLGSHSGHASSFQRPPPMLRVSSKTLDLVR